MRFSTVALALVLPVLALSCGGGSAPSIPQADACSQSSKSVCAKLFSCTDPILVGAQQTFGGTEEMCETMIQQMYCAPFMCMPSEYHGDKAQQCKDQFATLSCTTLSSAVLTAIFGAGGAQGALSTVLATVPACSQVCPASDAGLSSGG
jgi:hypothetical protein